MSEKAIDRAREHLLLKVIEPALAHPRLSENIKDRVRNSKRWIERFAKVGDLLAYVRRFQGEQSRDTYEALHEHGLQTFEDVLTDFESEFSVWANDRTTPESFVIGESYDSFRILAFVGVYDTRAGGMFILGRTAKPDAIVVKATLRGGRYENAWIEKSEALKYFLKSRGGVFGVHFQENAAIIQNPDTPILCFVRESADQRFRYEGPFRSRAVNEERDGAKWFHLVRASSLQGVGVATDMDFDNRQLEAAVINARKLTNGELERRLEDQPKIPARRVLTTIGFHRSPYVIAAVLRRSAGLCEICAKPAPFARPDGTPYLEVHHQVRLADGGQDTVENAVAACPNCHRQAHFGAG